MSDETPEGVPFVLLQPELLAGLVGARAESMMRRRIAAPPELLDDICRAAGHVANRAVLQVGEAARRLNPAGNTLVELREWLTAENIADAERAGEPPQPQPVGPSPAPTNPQITVPKPGPRQLVSILVSLALAKAATVVLDWGKHDG